MIPITRRWCLAALAGAPVALGMTAQALSVRLDDHFLLVSAPKLDFLTDKQCQRMKDLGGTIGYSGQLSVSSGADRSVLGRSILHFAFSYDIWTERFKVTVITPGVKEPTYSKNLTREGAQAWCLDQLKIDILHLPTDRPVVVRLDIRSDEPRETAGVIGDPGISLSGLIALFSHPPKNQQVHLTEEVGPLNISDLRKPRS